MKTLLVEPNRYFDSVFLMRISADLEELDGVNQAVVAMATPVNVENLERSGFSFEREVAPSDLVIALDAVSQDAVEGAHARLAKLLSGVDLEETASSGAPRPSTLDEVLATEPKANLALISVPGLHAAREARQALQRGLHVMLFSDNVSAEDEISLKEDAVARGLLMMGPDCGTAILNGAPLGFANVCRRGTIGIVGASGTGIQEISSLIHQQGGGISQAIGTGGRDLSEAVDGRMTRFGISALGADPQTSVIVVVSKTPSPAVAKRVLAVLEETGKPGVVHFIGDEAGTVSESVARTATLADAAASAVQLAGVEPQTRVGSEKDTRRLPQVGTDQLIRGFFCGGTLCQEAWNLLHRSGLSIQSNVAGESASKIPAGARANGHVVWDLGDDAFTVGKPHPMIEPSLRDEHVALAGTEPNVGVILVDCVIGYGAHENPAASLADAAEEAFAAARQAGKPLAILASVTGTNEDPQRRDQQVALLREAGVVVLPSNAAVARAAAKLIGGEPK